MTWIIVVLCLSSILGDWAVTGDLDAAMDRAGMRAAVLFKLAASNVGLRRWGQNNPPCNAPLVAACAISHLWRGRWSV